MLGAMEISVLRWAIASFLTGVAALAFGSIPLVALCVGASSDTFDHAALAALIVAVGCLLLVVVALDLLGERARRTAPRRPRPRLVERHQ